MFITVSNNLFVSILTNSMFCVLNLKEKKAAERRKQDEKVIINTLKVVK